jgi:hypothetical protein
MHSERFLSHTLFPAIREAGFEIHEHQEMCFFRVRADDTVWVSDCDTGEMTMAGRNIEEKRKVVEQLIGRQCGNVKKGSRHVRRLLALDCKRSHKL